MGLTSALQSAASGLRAQSQLSALVSDNVANASTPGYVRKDGVTQSRLLNGLGQGVDLEQVRAAATDPLMRDLRRALTEMEGAAVQVDALARYTSVHGDPSEGRSIASRIQALESAFQEAAASPSSQTALKNVLDAARDVTRSLSSISDAVGSERGAAEQAIAQRVGAVTDNLTKIDALNDRIVRTLSTGEDASGLLDERDRLVNAIAEDLPIRTYAREDGALVVMTKGGNTLLDGEVADIAFTPLPVLTPDLQYPASSPPMSGLLIDGVDVAPASGAAGALDNGRLAGLFTIRDTTMPEFQRQADTLAAQLADAFEAADLSVPGGGVTGLFIDSANPAVGVDPAAFPPGLAGRLDINPIVDPGAGGDVTKLRDGLHGPVTAVADPTQLFAFLDAFSVDQPFDPAVGLGTDVSLGSYASAMIGNQQTTRLSLETEQEAASISQTTLETAVSNYSGVNLDLQLKALQEIENAYAANAQALQAVNRMYDVLLSMVR